MQYLKNNKMQVKGLFLFLIYLGQILIPWNKESLMNFQNESIVRIITGITLLFVILSQWIISFARIILKLENPKLEKLLYIHKWIGTLCPILFMMHSINPGYGLLFLLTTLFFSNHFISSIQRKSSFFLSFYPAYILIHILLSILILLLSGLHIYLVITY